MGTALAALQHARRLRRPFHLPSKGTAMRTQNQITGLPDAEAGVGSTGDAVSLLSIDHADVAELFEEYEALVETGGADEEKQALAENICALLTAHATVEEEIFYPAARDALDDQELLDEAEVEHATAKDLIEQIQSMDPGDELYDAKVKVLGEYVNHHVLEEEGEIFPKCQTSDMDLDELGEEISARKVELLEELGVSDPDGRE
jgi:hemerythrin superfamily protein